MPVGQPVLHGERAGVGLVPDHGVAQDPPVGLGCERHAPGQADEVLVRHTGTRPVPRLPVLSGARAVVAVAVGRVAVAQVQPRRRGGGEEALGFVEDLTKVLHVLVRRGLVPVLQVGPDRPTRRATPGRHDLVGTIVSPGGPVAGVVVPQSPVRREVTRQSAECAGRVRRTSTASPVSRVMVGRTGFTTASRGGAVRGGRGRCRGRPG